MPFAPQIAVILGSSLGPFAKRLQNTVEIDYHDIPNFPVSTAPGHAGKLIFGELAEKRLVCLAGRFHSYEGYDFEQLTQPVRLLKLLGVQALIVTNAAGGVNLSYHRGDFMLIADHIKLNGSSPLRGRNVDEFGPRFFDVTRMYTPELRALAKTCADELGIRVQEGVYFFMPGPQFETPAEIRTIRTLGKETYMETRYDGALGESYRAIEGTNFYDALYSPVILTVNAVVVGAVMLLSASGKPAVLTLFGMTAGTAVTVLACGLWS